MQIGPFCFARKDPFLLSKVHGEVSTLDLGLKEPGIKFYFYHFFCGVANLSLFNSKNRADTVT